MKNKFTPYIFGLLLLMIVSSGIAQTTTSSTTKRIDDNGTTLDLYVDMQSGDRNVNFKKEFNVKEMSQMQKDALVKHIIDSLGVSSEPAEEPINRTGPTEIKSAIEKLNRGMEDAFNKNDMANVASFYADNAEISADNYSVKGRSSIDKHWMALKDKGRGWKLDIVEIGGKGEFVYQLRRSDLDHVTGANNTPAKSVTNFILIWRLQPDGYYKIFKDYLTKTQFKRAG